MKRILIFGNSGSGKSTLAKKLCSSENLAHLDLDTLAWEPVSPPERRSLAVSSLQIAEFTHLNQGWVIEGCYTDLLEMVVPESTEIIFLKLPVEACISNAKKRPWEPHKYESKEAQDANLGMLVDWISQYSERSDTFSQQSHQKLYDDYAGEKTTLVRNETLT